MDGPANFHLALAAAAEGDLAAAAAAYRRVIADQDEEYRPLAMTSLGTILRGKGDMDEAVALYRAAVDTGDVDAAPMACLQLGGTFEVTGPAEAAVDYYRQAMGARHENVSPIAAHALGRMLEAQRDLVGAAAAYRQAITYQGFNRAGDAALRLARLLRRQGGLLEAEKACRLAIRSNDAETSAEALVQLGLLAQDHGNLDAAQDAFDRAVERGGNAAKRGRLGRQRLARAKVARAQLTTQRGSHPAENLERVLLTQRLVVLVGAGVSMDAPAGLPDWTQLRDLTVSAVASRHEGLSVFGHALNELPMISLPDKKGLPPEVIASIISTTCPGYFQSFRTLQEGTPNYNHDLLARAAAEGLVHYIVTTNFDTFIESALESLGIPYLVYRSDEEFRSFQAFEDAYVHVLKIHGSIDLPESITATVEQEARGLTAAKSAALDDLLDDRWLAVWGYSGADLKIDVDYLRLLRNRERCRGFFWSLFARGGYAEKPNRFVSSLVAEYGAEAMIGENLLLSVLESTLPELLPQQPMMDQTQLAAQEELKSDRLSTALYGWARFFVDEFSACVIIGDLLRYAGRTFEAVQCYCYAENLAQAHASLQHQAYALSLQSNIATESGDFSKAISLWQQVADIGQRLGDNSIIVRSLSGRAYVANRQGDLFTAQRLTSMVRELGEVGTSSSLPTFILGDLAIFRRDQGNYDESFELWKEAVRRHRESGDRQSLTTALRGMAAAHFKFGEFREAKTLLLEAKQYDAAIGYRNGLVQSLVQLFQAQMVSDDAELSLVGAAPAVVISATDEALASLLEAERLVPEVEGESLRLSVLEARLTWNRARHGAVTDSETLAAAESLVEGWRKLKEKRRLGASLENLAQLLSESDPDRAQNVAVEALTACLEAEDRLNAGLIGQNMAHDAIGRGDYEQAFTYFQLSITCLRMVGQNGLAARMLEQLRPVVAELNKTPPWTLESVAEALAEMSDDELHKIRAELACEQGSGSLAECLTGVAKSEGEGAAVQMLNVAIKKASVKAREDGIDWSPWSAAGLRVSQLIRDDYAAGICVNDLGVAMRQMGDLDAAIRCYSGAAQIAKDLFDPVEATVRYGNLASVLSARSRAEEAVAAALEAGKAARSVLREGRLSSLIYAGSVLEELKQWDESLRCFTEAVLPANDALDGAALARAHQGRGKALRELGKLGESAVAREAAAQIYSSIGDDMNACVMYMLAGRCLMAVPQAEERAKALLELSLRIAEARGIDSVAEKARESILTLSREHS